jgi:oligopeptidase B
MPSLVASGLLIQSIPTAKRLLLGLRRSLVSGLAAALVFGWSGCAEHIATQTNTLQPPIAKRVDYAVASPFGNRNDPYYWLRDDTRKNPDMLAYLAAENAYTNQYFAPLQKQIDTVFAEIKARIKQDDASVPTLEHGYWYYSRFVKGQQYPIYARRRGSMSAPEQILLDGNALAVASNTGYFNIGASEVSPDGKRLAYATDTVGRRQYRIQVKELSSGKDLGVNIEKVTADLVWANDNQTLFFTDDNDETLLPYRLFRCQIDAPAVKPELVYEEKDNTFYLGVERSKSERYIMITSGSTLTTEVRLLPSDQPAQSPQILLARERGHEYSVDHKDGQFYFRSNRAGAHNFALFRAPEKIPTDVSSWTPVLAHRADALLESFELYAQHIAVNERSGGLRKIRLLALDGTLDATTTLARSTLLKADDPSYVMNLISTPDIASDTLRYRYDSLTTPGTVYALNLTTDARLVLKQDPVLGRFKASDYRSEYVFAKAADGALIPVSIVYKTSTPRDGSAPLYQYAYGSYGSAVEPYFNAARLSLLDRGFVYAIAHIRGGEEMGRTWYEEGKLLKKKNTFSDFVAVTDFLVQNQYGAKDKIVAAGGSAGGLLMGAVLNLAPEKYRAVAAHVPFVDVVTTMLDESIPLTTGEFDEWGNPKQQPYYDYMLSYSPYDQVKAQNYPTLLVTTGLHDSQVQYYEPAKWVAKLRAMKTDRNPLVFKINMQAGHGGRSGRFDRLKETAQEYVFFMDAVGRL